MTIVPSARLTSGEISGAFSACSLKRCQVLASLIERGSKLGALAIDSTSLFGNSMTMAAARLPVVSSRL